MKELMEYFESVGAQVNDEICSLKGKDVPEALCEFYDTIGSVDLPYGTIYNLDTAVKLSEAAPFSPQWFVFGKDHYFCYWLCYKGKNKDGYYFTYWDHDSGLDIEPPVWEDLLTFLRDVEEDSREDG